MANASLAPRPKLTMVQWLICAIAAIGFAFDTYELLMLPLVVRDALFELGKLAPSDPEFGVWVGRLFFIPAFAGGIFGLLGGYLTDRLGRRRVLTWSILLYAVSAFLSGYSTSIEMLLVLRCTTFIGVCVEFVAAVAWLAELFPDVQRREKVLGYTQAFSSIGGLLIAVANGLAVKYAADLPAIASTFFGDVVNHHAAWRYTLMSGLIPAIPLILIRPFLPESPAWQQKRSAGTLRRPSIRELFAPELRKVTIVTTLMFACAYGAAFGAIQHIPRMVPGLQEVHAKADAALAKASAADPTIKPGTPAAKRVTSPVEQKVAAEYTKMQEIGGLVGRFLLALLAVRIVSRRSLLRIFQFPGVLIVPLVFFLFFKIPNTTWYTIDLNFLMLGEIPITPLTLAIMLAGLVTVAQFSFWGNYLPQAYPLHLRGTGESFAANIGGRMIGTSFAWVTSTLAVQPWMRGDTAPAKLAYTAAGVALFVYVAGAILSFYLPEPRPQVDE
jgi:MFS family permease